MSHQTDHDLTRLAGIVPFESEEEDTRAIFFENVRERLVPNHRRAVAWEYTDWGRYLHNVRREAGIPKEPGPDAPLEHVAAVAAVDLCFVAGISMADGPQEVCDRAKAIMLLRCAAMILQHSEDGGASLIPEIEALVARAGGAA